MLASSSGLIEVFSSSLSLRAQKHSPANLIAGRSANCTSKLSPCQRVNDDRECASGNEPRRRDLVQRQQAASGRIGVGHKNVTELVRGQLEHGQTVTRPPASSSSSCQLSTGSTTTTPSNSPSELKRKQQVQQLTRMFSHWRTRRETPELQYWTTRPGATTGVMNGRLGAARGIQPASPLDRLGRDRTRSPDRLEVRLSPAAALIARNLAQNAQTPANSSPAEAHVALSVTRNHTAYTGTMHHNHHHNHHLVNVNERGASAGLAPNGPSCAGRDDDDESNLKSQRPWQSLVLPVVLACMIFLVALWTRQISLAITNDKILMILILIGLFITMSGLALWLSCDQYLDEEREARVPDVPEHQIHDGTAQAHCHCRHDRHQFHGSNNHHPHCHQNQQHEAGNSAMNVSTADGRRCRKCCGGISVIDCHPPDYYSAVKNSMPIQHYLTMEHQNKHSNESRDGGHDHDGPKGEAGDAQLYLLPPSYEELQKR